MRLRDIIRAPKRITSLGEWRDGKMPRTAFPLSKSGNKAYRLGNRRWRVVTFEALDAEMRLLITYSSTLGQFQATLGLVHLHDMKVLAQLERHPTHKGWHMHAGCDDVSMIPGGIRRGPWIRDLGSKPGHRHPLPVDLTDEDAFKVARQTFKLYKVMPLELGQ